MRYGTGIPLGINVDILVYVKDACSYVRCKSGEIRVRKGGFVDQKRAELIDTRDEAKEFRGAPTYADDLDIM